MSNLDGLKKKIRSLLEVAKPGSGATEPERDTARRLAERLLAANGLRECDIPERVIGRDLVVPREDVVPFPFVFGGFAHDTTNSTTGDDFTGGIFVWFQERRVNL